MPISPSPIDAVPKILWQSGFLHQYIGPAAFSNKHFEGSGSHAALLATH